MLHDPIEMTKEYKEAMEKIQPILDEEFPMDKWRMDTCHRFWYRKTELLAEMGIKWRSPAVMNPNARFD
ncbi:MAG: hypothetical protein IKL88_07245 [Erysipelotrichales bacterium]|nr:hypothetical protein [Erysipelotrichales bacterium]